MQNEARQNQARYPPLCQAVSSIDRWMRWQMGPCSRSMVGFLEGGGNWLSGHLLKWICGKCYDCGLIVTFPKTQSSMKRSMVWDCGNLASSPWEWTCSPPPSTRRWAPPSCSWPTWLATPPRSRSTSFAVPQVQVLCLCRCLPLLMALELLLSW